MADLEAFSTPLLSQPPTTAGTKKRSFLILSGVLILCFAVGFLVNQHYFDFDSDQTPESGLEETREVRPEVVIVEADSRGVSEGVSEKKFIGLGGDMFPWTNFMLSWQRSGFHFQPENNWMNDPNGPLFYKGWYHLFYQYNPHGAVWGNIVWGHAVSRDMINWRHLPLAMVADHWYDINGVFTGSATILKDGSIVMLYTGFTNESVQVQNVAFPADLSDPLLISWVKHPANPVLLPPPGIGKTDFRDPTTAWLAPNGNWLLTIGSKINKTGVSLLYETKDFVQYKLLDGLLHQVPGTGIWECIDFYPVSVAQTNGLDTSVNGPEVKHVMKASLQDDNMDYYALGTYEINKNLWTPDNPELDFGIGLKYDYGKFYASKSFYDQNKKRRILWGWTKETDSEHTDIMKGWASLMTIPREVVFDKNTGTNVLQWPVADIESLRSNKKEFSQIKLEAGSIVPLSVGEATQLDITAEFEVDKKALEAIMDVDYGFQCNNGDGAAGRNAFGPFGLLVLADEKRSEQTAVYFYIAKGADGSLQTFFCSDRSRSSLAADVDKEIYGSTVPVLKDEKFSVRLLVDHSIVEAFAQGGRTCITSRIYPTMAIGNAARVFLFNNATGTSVTATSVNIWKMGSADIRPYFEEQIA